MLVARLDLTRVGLAASLTRSDDPTRVRRYGRTRARSLPPTPQLLAANGELGAEELARCLAIPSACLRSTRSPEATAGGASALGSVEIESPGAGAGHGHGLGLRAASELSWTESEDSEHVPMRVDSFGDVVRADGR